MPRRWRYEYENQSHTIPSPARPSICRATSTRPRRCYRSPDLLRFPARKWRVRPFNAEDCRGTGGGFGCSRRPYLQGEDEMTSLSEQKMFDISDLGHLASPRTWRRLISRGEIGILRIGGAVKVPEAELEKFLAARFTPARSARKEEQQNVVAILDQALPRKRRAS